MWLNSLFSSGLTTLDVNINKNIPFDIDCSLIGEYPHKISNNNIECINYFELDPEFINYNEFKLEYIRYSDNILLFINNYIAKYDIEDFKNMIHTNPLNQLELKGCSLSDQVYFKENCHEITSIELLKELLNTFDNNLYFKTIKVTDPSLIKIFNIPKTSIIYINNI